MIQAAKRFGFFTPFHAQDEDDRYLGPLHVSQAAYEALTPTQKTYKTALLVLSCAGIMAGLYTSVGILTAPFCNEFTVGWGEDGKGLLGGIAQGALQGIVMGVVMSPEFSRRTGLFQSPEIQPVAQGFTYKAG